MILLVTNKDDITTDFIVNRLNKEERDYYRFNTEEIVSNVDVNFDFENNDFFLFDRKKGTNVDLSRVKSVYFRRPKLPEIHYQSATEGENNFILNEVTFLLEGLYKILESKFWISSVFAIREAENKIYQLCLAKKMGFKTPFSLITSIKENAETFVNRNKSCIIKPIKSGLINDKEGSKIVFTNILKEQHKESLERVRHCPSFFQNRIEKMADIRVTVVGKKVFPAKIITQNAGEHQTDWRQVSPEKVNYEKIKLPTDLKNKCVQLTKNLGLQFGAIDFILDTKNEFFFLEINPNGQWAWIEKRLGIDISGAIIDLLLKERN